MAYETKELTGNIFKNNDRSADNHPNGKGEVKIAGVVYEVAAWTKKDKNGDGYQFLVFKPKGERGTRTAAPKTREPGMDDETEPF
jgi:hypothetical protein